MRFLFLLIVIANVGIFAYGQGLFGAPPSDKGRQTQHAAQTKELNPQAITLGTPTAIQQTPN